MASIGEDLQEIVRRARPERTLITTYAASLSYLEAGLLDALTEHGRPAVRVLLDTSAQVDTLGELGLRYHGIRYEVHPITVPGGYRFHPKTYALLNEDRVTLVVASANLTVPGFRRNWEVFDVLEAARDGSFGGAAVRGDTRALLGYCDFLERLAQGAVELSPAAATAVTQTARDLRDLLGQDAEAQQNGPWFLHSLEVPILDQLVALTAGTPITRVTAFSPYFDPGTEAVRRMLRAFPEAARVRVVLDPTSESAFNGVALRRHAKRLDVFHVREEDGERRRFLHAKLLALWGPKGAWVVSGSANLTTAGLCGAAAPASGRATGNVEAVTVRFLPVPTAIKPLLSAVPAVPWTTWQDADAADLKEEVLHAHTSAPRLLDAEVDTTVVRCVLNAAGWGRTLPRTADVRIHIEHVGGRLILRADEVRMDGEHIVVEARCDDAAFTGGDEPALAEVEVTSDGNGRWSARGWIRRPTELRRTAASVTLRQRLRALRDTPMPDANTLLEVHSALAALLCRLGRGETAGAAAFELPSATLPGRRSSSAKRDGRSRGGILDLGDLLSDETEGEATTTHGAGARAQDDLHAISDALRAHLHGERAARQAPVRRDGTDANPETRRVTRRVDRPALRTAVASAAVARRARVPALAHDDAVQVARLATFFAGALRSTRASESGYVTVLNMAEPIGTALLAADVLRAPASPASTSGMPGPRASLMDAVTAWWGALLGVAPGADGAPRGLLIRAWAPAEHRGLIEAALAESAVSPAAGLEGLTSGLGVARALLRLERGTDEALDDAVVGLSLLATALKRTDRELWGDETRERAAQATAWWPDATTGEVLDHVWAAPRPRTLPVVALLERWDALLLAATAGSLQPSDDLPLGLLQRVARVRRRYPDPIATFDPGSQSTSCCPAFRTPSVFAAEAKRAWPSVAACPTCGRIIAPPELRHPATRIVVAWFRHHTNQPSGSAHV